MFLVAAAEFFSNIQQTRMKMFAIELADFSLFYLGMHDVGFRHNVPIFSTSFWPIADADICTSIFPPNCREHQVSWN